MRNFLFAQTNRSSGNLILAYDWIDLAATRDGRFLYVELGVADGLNS